MDSCKDTKSATHRMENVQLFTEYYYVEIDRLEALHIIQHISKGKNGSRIWRKKYSSHDLYSRKWYVYYSGWYMCVYECQYFNKCSMNKIFIYINRISQCSSISSKCANSKCHIYFCHCHLGTTKEPKWEFARI